MNKITGWLFGLIVIMIGLLNIFLVDPRPGVIYIFLSLVFLPPVSEIFNEKFNFSISPVFKVVLGIIIIWFTLGISDLGDIMDKIFK